MKKKKVVYAICLGLATFFICAGVVYADTHNITSVLGGSTGDIFDVKGAMSFDSIQVGRQGTGGVTYFNGSIVNTTTGTGGADNPVTFGDNVRIDGRVYRGVTAGTGDTLPFMVNDNMEVAGSLTTGSLSTGVLTATSLSGTGIVSSANLASDSVTSAKISDGTIAPGDIADSAITTAKITDGTIATGDLADSAVTSAKISDATIIGSDISSSADLSIDTIAATGNLTQTATANGLLKGWAYMDSDGDIYASYNVTSASRTAEGHYAVVFNFAVNDGAGFATRAYIATPSGIGGAVAKRMIGAAPHASNVNTVIVWAMDDTNAFADSNFMLAIY